LSLSLDLGDIKSCFGEIRWLENEGWNLSFLLYIHYQNKKYLIQLAIRQISVLKLYYEHLFVKLL
jgi:hypothetical protein